MSPPELNALGEGRKFVVTIGANVTAHFITEADVGRFAVQCH